jgi:hypothetical protein
MYIYSISYVVLCYHIYSRLSRTAKWIITWMFILLAKINKLQQLHMRRSVFLRGWELPYSCRVLPAMNSWVLPESWGITKGFLTWWTAEWFLACMNSWMCFKLARSCKRLWTKSTTEWFLSCMNSWMYFQMLSVCKRLWTKSTTEWFLSRMNSWMCFQMAKLCKRLQTDITTEWFLSRMNSWMCFQMAKLCKRLQTESTTEWFLSCMNSCMNTESWWIPEGFITHWTPEASLWMTSQMNLESVWRRKRLCTLGTTMKILSCSCYFISEITKSK